MNKYNIKVGDYVETVDGGIGYVTEVFDEDFNWMIVTPRNISRCTPKGEITSGSFDDKIYKRIGSIDFSKKENEFESIKKIDSFCDFNEVVCKINELIDCINLIQKRLDGNGAEKERP